MADSDSDNESSVNINSSKDIKISGKESLLTDALYNKALYKIIY